MSEEKKEDEDLESNNPLLREIAKLRLAQLINMEEAGAEGSLKQGLDLLSEDIIADTIARHPEVKIEIFYKE